MNHNRRLIKPEEQYPYSLLDVNLLKEQESNFSFKGIFKKKDSSDSGNDNSSNDNSGSAKEKSGAGFGIISSILEIAGSLTTVLPSLGIGSKSRIAEANAMAGINKSNNQLLMEAEDQKADNLKTIILIGGVMIFLVVIVAVTLKK